MKLLRGASHRFHFVKGVVASIGNFDGVHLGHQSLIQKLKTKAHEHNLPTVIILFEPQPREHFQHENAPARLSSLREKLEMLKKCQIDYVYCIKFDEQFAKLSGKDFVHTHLFQILNIKHLFVGKDFRFGKDRVGDVNLLQSMAQENSCEIHVLSDFNIEHEKVSSTKIRDALQKGNLQTAATYLGRTYSLCGRVIHGDERGRQWGIPTANLSLHRLSLPLQGVYVVRVKVGSRIVFGVANVGKRPTVDGTKNILEVHLFDFSDSIYGELMQVFFLHKLRDEVKFTSVDALIAQIHDDIAAAKAFLKDYFNNDDKNRQKINDFAE